MLKKFETFAKSSLTLQVWHNGKIILKSKKEGIKGLLDFAKKHDRKFDDLIVFDKVIGNAAALLCVYLGAKEIYAFLGSKPAKKTLKKYKTKFYFKKTIPNILNKTKTDLCPMEKLSKRKTPVQFLSALKLK